MGLIKLSSPSARLSVLCLAILVMASVAACSDDPEEVSESTTSSATTTSPSASTTTPVVVTTEVIPTTTSVTPTTVAFPNRAVLEYFQDMQGVSVRIGEAVLDMRAANNDWDNRVKSYQETVSLLESLERRTRSLRDDIALIEPPPDRGLPVEHQTAWVAVGQMADAAVEALSGLRSTDTGERRRAALTEFLVAYQRYDAAFGRIVEIIGLGADISLPTVETTGTTEATTTTTTAAAATTTTAAATTTSTAAAATTTTTAAATTTSTTEATTTTTAATTTSTTAATGTDTVPPTPKVSYAVITEEASPIDGAKRTWLTVAVAKGAAKSDLAQIAERLAFEYRVVQQYQALLIYFVHFPEEVDTLGTWIHAPFGNWTRAAEVSAGDYSQHAVNDQTVEKDWSLLPTDNQVMLYRLYKMYRDDLRDTGASVPPDEQLIPLAAQVLQVPTADLREAVAAWEAWEAR